MQKQLIATESGRLDKLLSSMLNESRNQVEKLILEGLVSVNGKTISKSSYKLSIGDTVEYRYATAETKEPIEIDFDIEILYEDDDLMIINKPSGLVVHPAPSVKGATLVDWLIYKGISLSTISGEERHGIVHRIDKETTGALVIAKNNDTHRALSEQLQDKSMGRYYLAIIDQPIKENRRINRSIARNRKNRLKMSIEPDGRTAKTEFISIQQSRLKSELIAAKLYTGRTHQIRVHLESIGRHILGDELYGYKSKSKNIPRIYLHAYMLYMTHPKTGEMLEVVAPLHSDMSDYLDKYFNQGEISEKIDNKVLKNSFSHASFVE